MQRMMFGGAAPLYRERGWHPIPAGRDKAPLIKDYPHADKWDDTKYTALCQQYGNCNTGIALFGVIALDIDNEPWHPGKHGIDTLARLEEELGKLPQAIAWHMPECAYLFNTVALYVRQFRLCESGEAKAADRATLQRYADTIGLTPQGLKMNGWRIVDFEKKPSGVESVDSSKIVRFQSARERFAQMDD